MVELEIRLLFSSVTVVALAMARILPILSLIPAFGGQLVPITVRIGLACMIAISSAAPIHAEIFRLANLSVGALTLIVLKEVMIGATIGFLTALCFSAAESAGLLIDQLRGATQFESVVPTQNYRGSPLGNLFLLMAGIVFFAIGGHHIILAALAESYRLLPIGELPSSTNMRTAFIQIIRASSGMLLIAVAFAAPILCATVLIDVIFGYANRMIPQLPTYFLVMPLKSIIGLITLAAVLASTVEFFPTILRQSLATSQTVLSPIP